ncbi:unnamed protein product [Ambrosiozyma monospora]|uniref:Unnamed protein product n=1 Tax=Ambrosiozyma monospora TaxID=43982 RepID=A0A9W6Z796_AMBMO|nr:unnamed protein product [Ambrosiozyma monospora]
MPRGLRRSRRQLSDDEDEYQENNDSFINDEEEYQPHRESHKRQRTQTQTQTLQSEADDSMTYNYTAGSDSRTEKIDKLVKAFVRVMIGLEDKRQTLNKVMIAKVMESEKEKGTGIQFKKHLLSLIRKNLRDVFGLDLVELNNIQELDGDANGNGQDNQNKSKKAKSTAAAPAEEYILINLTGSATKSQMVAALEDFTLPITSVKDVQITDQLEITRSGPLLPKPVTSLVSDGFMLLVLTIIVLNNNNLSRMDLATILSKKFHLKFKETERYELFNNDNLSNYLTELVRREYLSQLDISEEVVGNGNKKKRGGSRISKVNAQAKDESLLILSLGRRTITEFTKEGFINYLRQIYSHWDENNLQTKAENTLEQLFVSSITTE